MSETPDWPSINEESNDRASAEVTYAQALELVRSGHASLAQESTVLSIILVTMIGFAIDRQSWGVSAAALAVYPAKLLALRSWSTLASSLLGFSASLENDRGPSCRILKDYPGYVSRGMHRSLVVVVAAIHVAFLAYAVTRDNWTILGG